VLLLPEEFRKSALECLALSQKADSIESRCLWVAMAQFWFNLAVHAEDREAIESVDPSAVAASKDNVKPK
jgi:hypothetical protein